MEKEHSYEIEVKWTGNRGSGTSSYAGYDRNHEIGSTTKGIIPGSSDPSFRGDPLRYNPEELLVSTLSSCHMLFYLHLCSANKITVVDYVDRATGVMKETKSGGGFFTSATLKPQVTILEKDKVDLANELHHQAHELCFIANSVNFEVKVKSELNVQQ